MRTNAAFIGAGNLAWHLAPALDNAGIIITHVYNRTAESGSALVKRLYQAELQQDLDFSAKNIDLLFICVTDDVLEEIVPDIIIDESTLVIHTAGAKDIQILNGNFNYCGIFYPLQTFSKPRKVNFKDIPILIEGSDPQVLSKLNEVAKKLSRNIYAVTSEERLKVHIAAVFASNFSNHMITIAKTLLKEQKLDLHILFPLISETINKSLTLGPEQAQTGPARRHDLRTMDKHLGALENDEELNEIYRIISQHILDNYY